jgi:hypothetical protein
MRISCFSFRYVFAFLCLAAMAAAQGSKPELWYWQLAYPTTQDGVTSIESQIDQAASYGYTGVAFWSSSFTFMASPVYPAPNVAYMQQVMAYAQSKGLKTMAHVAPYGYSDDALVNNPNWAEGQHVTGSQFTVNASKTALLPVNSFSGLVNPGFESGNTAWFGYNDPNMGIDNTVFHTGAASGYVTRPVGNSRFAQSLHLTPWRQYHASVWVKTAGFQGYSQVEIWDAATNLLLQNVVIRMQPTQDWTKVEFAFNSRGSSQPLMLFGVWGGGSGTIWFDDVLVEETALVYLLRRPGTPLNVYNPANPGIPYAEGSDFNPIADPSISSGALYPWKDLYHTPVTVTLPSTTSLQPGQTVAMDYYAVQPVSAGGDVGLCLTEAGAQGWFRQNTQAVVANVPAGTGYLLSYDEMRHMNSCAACKARNLTPGQLLASHASSTATMMRSLAPSAPLYIWSDMFDPYHNAVDNYYFVEGDISGSWRGVDSDITIMNWNLGNLKNSLTWFSGLNPQQTISHHQIIAGYYDTGDGAGAATQELQQAAGIPGINGLMYTTWATDYSQLQAFATAALNAWPQYLSSTVANVTSQFSISPSAVTYNRGTGVYSQSIKLTNHGAAVASSAYVLDSLPAGVSVQAPSGLTSAALPAGSPYKETGAIGAGATVTITVKFARTGTQAITYTPRMLGAGPR